MKQQVLVIGGGDTFSSKEEYLDYLQNISIRFEKITKLGWKDNLRSDLGDNFEVILPQMPNKTNARYKEWKIIFEKLFPFLSDEIILVGHSMGGVFISKYLAENDFPNKIKATYLVAAPYGDNQPDYELLTFSLSKDLKRFNNQSGQTTIYQSEDDESVPPADASKYKNILPDAELKLFTNRGHFGQEHFWELVDSIKKL